MSQRPFIEAPRGYKLSWTPVGQDDAGWEKGYMTEIFVLARDYIRVPETPWQLATCMLKMSYVTEDSWERFNSTPLRYISTRGWCVGDPSGMTDIEIFHKVYAYLPRVRNMPEAERLALSEEEIREIIEQHFAYKHNRTTELWEQTRDQVVGYAYTDFYLDSPQGSTSDHVLYVYLTLLAAKHYASMGLVTHGSIYAHGIEEATWATLCKMGLTERHLLGGDSNQACFVIDTDRYDIELPGEPLDLFPAPAR